jgi:hypothetical protein
VYCVNPRSYSIGIYSCPNFPALQHYYVILFHRDLRSLTVGMSFNNLTSLSSNPVLRVFLNPRYTPLLFIFSSRLSTLPATSHFTPGATISGMLPDSLIYLSRSLILVSSRIRLSVRSSHINQKTEFSCYLSIPVARPGFSRLSSALWIGSRVGERRAVDDLFPS